RRGGDPGHCRARLTCAPRCGLFFRRGKASMTEVSGAIGNEDAARFLLRAQFSAREDDIRAVRELGYRAWLDRQFAAPRGQKGYDWLDATGRNAVTEDGRYFWPQAGDYMIWNQLLAQPGEMRLRAAYALSQF